MAHISSPRKAARATTHPIDPSAAVHTNGVSVTPPPYGIDFLDHGSIETRQNETLVFQQKTNRSKNAVDSRMGHQNHTGLPDNLKTGIEGLSGLSLEDVRVHYNSPRPTQLQAFAYAQGKEIHVAPGQERYLPHEAWHVVQQKQGRVKPTIKLKGVNINDNTQLEKEADTMGDRATNNRSGSSPALESRLSQKPVSNPVIQGGFWHNLGIGALSVLTLGLGALGYGAYRYYRHRRRENTLNNIRNEQANQPLVGPVNILPPGTPMDTPSLAYTHDTLLPQGTRNYQVDVNPNNPVGLGRTDPRLLRIAELHERTHISADMAYSSNQDQARMWLVHGDPVNDPNFGAHNIEQYQRIADRLIALENIIQNDSALTTVQRNEMLQRVNYAGQMIEYDPVINELLAYTQEYGIRANSRTVKALVKLARENLARRRPHGPHLQNAWPG